MGSAATHHYVYVDESGNLADPRDTLVTLAAIKTTHPHALRWIIKRAKRSIRRVYPKGRHHSEFKFYTATDGGRRKVLHLLAREEMEIYAVSVFTGPQVIPHTPTNYGFILLELLRMCELGEGDTVVIDVPFNTVAQREDLTTIARCIAPPSVTIEYVDSMKNPYVQLADFVAGAVRAGHSGYGWHLYHIIQSRIVAERVVRWKELRREWIEGQK